MKYLFLFLIGYAVKCEDVSNNYFVVEMPEIPPQDVKACKKPFNVYWNVPTKQCASRKVLFQNLYEKFGIIQNDNDIFIGEKITILYEPGDFPAIFKNETSGKYRLRNGGVPQEGDLDEHLIAFENDLNVSIPDPDFDGIGIIDFESWRPVYRQNFGNLVPYKDVSIAIETQLHWWWTTAMIQAEATRRFEAAAKQFMQTTLSTAKQLRPNALWGYYGFPQCFNMASNNLNENCANNVPEENDGTAWLWTESTALFPSIYSSVSLSTSQLSSLITGRVRESARVRVNNAPVLPYFWFKYRDAGFMSQVDLSAALSTLYKSKASGFVIWGSSNDVNTLDKCNSLYNYVETVLGPNIAKYTKQNNKINDDLDTTTLEPSTIEDISNEVVEQTTATIRIGQIDPEFDWIPPKNYSEDISQQVDEELTKKGFNKTVNQDFIMDLMFDALINAQSNLGNKNVREVKVGDNENYESSTFTSTDLNTSDLFTDDPNLIESDTESTASDGITNNENLYDPDLKESDTKSTTSDGITNNENLYDPNLKEYNTKSTTSDGIINNENLYNKEISSTEASVDSDEDIDKSIETNNEEISTQRTKFDENTQKYNEISETTENNRSENTTINNKISPEDKSNYLIIAEPNKNEVINNIENVTDSDYLIILKDYNEETTEFNTDKNNEETEDFREATDDLDQVVTYVYSK